MAFLLLRGGQQLLLPRTFITIVASKHGYSTHSSSCNLPLSSSSHPLPAGNTSPSPTGSRASPPTVSRAASNSKSKRIQIVEGDVLDNVFDTPVFSLRLCSPKDFRHMLRSSGLLCLVPARQDPATKTWRFSGEGTRCFSDLRENTFYMAMSAIRRPPPPAAPSSNIASHSLRETVRNVRNELANRARGEEGELTEALLRMFSTEAAGRFPDMASKQELRIIENEEVDAVLESAGAIAIGFHCNKLTLKEAAAAFTRVSQWSRKARTGSPQHSFLLGKDLYVVLSGNYLPNKETQQVISFCKKHNLIILLRNGANFSMHNSLLPSQQLLPANVHMKSNS